jgi:hypothetical protein
MDEGKNELNSCHVCGFKLEILYFSLCPNHHTEL